VKRVYLVDDYEDMRVLYHWSLTGLFADVEICGEAPSASRAIAEIPAAAPDLAIIDIMLPGMDGIALVRELRSRGFSNRVLVVTSNELERYRRAASEAGADAIASKADISGVLQTVQTLINTSPRSENSAPIPG
jgi:DNA-binding NarL/FixJ family response regulator